jgi:hypothetical protein
MPESIKECTRCKQLLPLSDFGTCSSKSRCGKNSIKYWCRNCCNNHELERNHKLGNSVAYTKSKSSGMYLGVHVAERLLSNVFVNVVRMPMGNPGFDFICGRGFKVDVKSATTHQFLYNHSRWNFHIKRNKIADYFACIAFDNRQSLTPLHFWLIPGNVVNNFISLSISNTHAGIMKWLEYEQQLDKVLSACNILNTT